jgi:hypothetical protein
MPGKKRSRRSCIESEIIHLDNLLDDALCATFPASDPVSITLHRPSFEMAVGKEASDSPKPAVPIPADASSTPQLAYLWEANLWHLRQMANFYAWWFRMLGGCDDD